jgi:hypothetical protein
VGIREIFQYGKGFNTPESLKNTVLTGVVLTNKINIYVFIFNFQKI